MEQELNISAPEGAQQKKNKRNYYRYRNNKKNTVTTESNVAKSEIVTIPEKQVIAGNVNKRVTEKINIHWSYNNAPEVAHKPKTGN